MKVKCTAIHLLCGWLNKILQGKNGCENKEDFFSFFAAIVTYLLKAFFHFVMGDGNFKKFSAAHAIA